MSLDTVENQPKLRVSGNSPAIMPKGGETPAPEPDENIVQPEPNGAPVRGAETVFRRDNEQTLADRVVDLERQLAETQRKNVELQRQLADAQAKLKSQAAKKERRQEQANERLKLWREQNPERVREQNTRHVRAYRARKRAQGS